MKSNQFWTTMSKALTAVTVLTIVTLILAISAAAEYKILHEFRMAKDGANPSGNLIMDAAGNLYGTTCCGGAHGSGTVFKLKPNPDGTWEEIVLYSFTGGADGANPSAGGGVIFDKAGNLYDTTAGGGADGVGVVFKLTPKPDGVWTETVLHTFTGADGAYPNAGLVLDTAGNLYGTTNVGGVGEGVVFKLEPNLDGTWTESVLYDFWGGTGGPGDFPLAGLTLDAAGNLYGTTHMGGGPYNDGAIFELTRSTDGTWAYSVLHGFDGADGLVPYQAGLILDAAGNLYGTTALGGGAGVAFELTPNPDGTWTEAVLHSFTGGADGAFPIASLVFDASGNLYGTTGGGGAYNDGVVFKLTPTSSGWRETVMHAFAGYGKSPQADVIIDAAGTLYGTVPSGTANNGFVFEIMKNCIDHTFVMPYNGTLYLQQKGGSAGASTEFGIGTSPTNFVKYYSGLPNNPSPAGEVLVGSFTKGTLINFGMFTQFGSQSGWAFTTGSTRASVVAFSDVDNSLGMGGKITQKTSSTTWLLHLDDALSYLYDDDDNDVLMQIRIVPQ